MAGTEYTIKHRGAVEFEGEDLTGEVTIENKYAWAESILQNVALCYQPPLTKIKLNTNEDWELGDLVKVQTNYLEAEDFLSSMRLVDVEDTTIPFVDVEDTEYPFLANVLLEANAIYRVAAKIYRDELTWDYELEEVYRLPFKFYNLYQYEYTSQFDFEDEIIVPGTPDTVYVWDGEDWIQPPYDYNPDTGEVTFPDLPEIPDIPPLFPPIPGMETPTSTIVIPYTPEPEEEEEETRQYFYYADGTTVVKEVAIPPKYPLQPFVDVLKWEKAMTFKDVDDFVFNFKDFEDIEENYPNIIYAGNWGIKMSFARKWDSGKGNFIAYGEGYLVRWEDYDVAATKSIGSFSNPHSVKLGRVGETVYLVYKSGTTIYAHGLNADLSYASSNSFSIGLDYPQDDIYVWNKFVVVYNCDGSIRIYDYTTGSLTYSIDETWLIPFRFSYASDEKLVFYMSSWGETNVYILEADGSVGLLSLDYSEDYAQFHEIASDGTYLTAKRMVYIDWNNPYEERGEESIELVYKISAYNNGSLIGTNTLENAYSRAYRDAGIYDGKAYFLTQNAIGLISVHSYDLTSGTISTAISSIDSGTFGRLSVFGHCLFYSKDGVVKCWFLDSPGTDPLVGHVYDDETFVPEISTYEDFALFGVKK